MGVPISKVSEKMVTSGYRLPKHGCT